MGYYNLPLTSEASIRSARILANNLVGLLMKLYLLILVGYGIAQIPRFT